MFAIDTPKQFLEMFQLDTLLGDKNCHVLNLKLPMPEDIDEKMAEEIPEKVVFSKGQTIGYIKKKILYVKSDFFAGGKFHNVFIGDELKMICQTYQLKGMQSIHEKQHLIDQLNYINDTIQVSVDLDEANLLLKEAEKITKQLQHEATTKTYHEMCAKVSSLQKGNLSTDIESVQKIKELKEMVYKVTDVNSIQRILIDVKKLAEKLPNTDDMKALYDFFSQVDNAMKANTIEHLLPNIQKQKSAFNATLTGNHSLQQNKLDKKGQTKVKMIMEILEQIRELKKDSQIIPLLTDAKNIWLELPVTPETKVFKKQFEEIESRISKKSK